MLENEHLHIRITTERYGERCPFCGSLERDHRRDRDVQTRCHTSNNKLPHSRAIPLDDVEQAIGAALIAYDTIFLNRADVLNHIFLIPGSGYRWRQGNTYSTLESVGEDPRSMQARVDVSGGAWPKWRSDELPRSFAEVPTFRAGSIGLLETIPTDIAPNWKAAIVETMKLVILRASIPVPPAEADPLFGKLEDLTDEERERRAKLVRQLLEAIETHEQDETNEPSEPFEEPTFKMPPKSLPSSYAFSYGEQDENEYNQRNARAAREFLKGFLDLSTREVLQLERDISC